MYVIFKFSDRFGWNYDLLKSSVLKGVIYLKAEKNVYNHLLHFPSGLEKKSTP